MKVLEINTERGWRGGERQTYYNIEGMKELGMDMTLLCRRGGHLSKAVKALRIPVFEVKGLFQSTWFLIRHGKKYDIIHAQTAKAQFYAVLTKWIHRKPVVYTRRVDFVPKGKLTFIKYRLTTKVVAISATIKDILDIFKIKDVPIISSAIAPKMLQKKRADEFIKMNGWEGKKIIATTAAFVQHKDPLTMVNAINELHKIRQDFVFLHFGTGRLVTEVLQGINNFQLTDFYKVMGFIDNVEDFFSVFDVFVMSSEEEGLGSSVLDAFIYKVPVASTNAGGLKEILNERGLLSPVKDFVQLADNIHKLLNDKELCKSLTEKAYTYVIEQHSVQKIATAYQELFSDIIS